MMTDELGMALPKRSFLTIILVGGQVIKTQIEDYGESVAAAIEKGLDTGETIMLRATPADERILTDTAYFVPANILAYSIMQLKPESRIHRVDANIQPV